MQTYAAGARGGRHERVRHLRRPGARPGAARARGPREGARAQLPHLRQDLRDGEQPAHPREDNARGQDGDLHRLLGTGRVAVQPVSASFHLIGLIKWVKYGPFL
jgi:hypothetical protein